MNGRIFVESKLGQGSTFKVCFPSIDAPEYATDAPTDELNPIESTNKSRVLKDVLLVEDVTSNSDVIRILLRDICNVDIVESGEEAIQIVKKKNYSAILMDIDLGIGMSGIETTKQIRKLGHYESTPIIAVTALAMKGHKEQFLAEGCSYYISKPFQSKEIREIVAGILNEQESRNQD
jgi:CheY-like chemotaxis protein